MVSGSRPQVPAPILLHGVLSLWLAALVLLPTRSTAAEPLDREEKQERIELIRGAVEFYNERSETSLFAPTPEQLEGLAGGEVVKIRRKVPVKEVESGEERYHERLTAYHLVAQPKLRVWLSALTPEFNTGEMLTEARLRADAHGNSRWYQHADLPWPVADRHWTIDLRKNPRLSRESGGRIWQHAWRLTDQGEQIARETVEAGLAGDLTPEAIEGAVYLPVNRGAWAMFELREDLTLIAYELSTSLGGSIPESLVNTLAMDQLDKLLREVGRISVHIDKMYVRGHSPIYSGDGYRIPWFGEEPPALELKSRCVLPAASFREGPASGQFIEASNHVTLPFDSQPVQGFSDIERHPTDGFWVISDNGYGARDTSADYVLCLYHLRPDFQNGTIEVLRTIELSDPERRAGFELVAERDHYPGSEIPVDERIRDGRLLTGYDFDPESFAVMPDGSFWVGEEFGPFLLRFDANGHLMRSPVATPGVQSAENPFLDTSTPRSVSSDQALHPSSGGDELHPSSGGFEGLTLSKDGGILYGLLEKTVPGDVPGQLRIYRVDANSGRFLEEEAYRRYPLAVDHGHYIGALGALSERSLAVVERDNEQGDAAEFKKVFVIDLEDHEDGVLRKRELVDLLRIPDPVPIAAEVEGSREKGSFAMPFVTIEGIVALDEHTLLLCNDNNYPFSVGRHLREGRPDDNELILIHLREPVTP